jgi:hypothetical protein
MENELVRYSRAGDVFHYRWAARRCLRMIHPKSSVKSIVIEGSQESNKAGEYVIDVAEYVNTSGNSNEQIAYFQLKHSTSTKRLEEAFTLSGLKDTIEGFAKRFSDLFDENDSNYLLENIKFAVITNRPIDSSFKENIIAISNQVNVKKQFQNTIEKYTQLKEEKLRDFCASLELVDGEGNYVSQRHDLHNEISKFLAGDVGDSQIDTIVALVQEKALPGSDGKIIREDILKRLGITSERDLFPAPLEFEKSNNFIKREQHEILLKSVLEASTPIIIHAGGGVGKSVFSCQLVESLPSGSLGVIYDCFGSGKYRNRSESRHRYRDALVQIINEIALHGLCELLIPRSTDLDDAILRAFRSRLEIAVTALRTIDRDAILVILIDAADNAEMAAKEFSESCFAHQLLRETMPEGCRIIALCRTERIDLLKPSSIVLQLELKSFSQAETLVHLREYFSNATDIDGSEFHRLTDGNPRVQANALSTDKNIISDVLASLGPSGTTVDEQIAAQLESAISRVKDKLPPDYQKYVDAMCLGLANLTPFIPIDVLASAADVEISTVKSFVADLGRPLWISENSVQFRDEPTETWFLERFSASVQQVELYVTRLKPLASKFSYVAQVLPSLLLQSENYDELIALALSDGYLPQDNPIDERNVRLYRLQFAFKAALKQKRYADAGKLALRAGEEVAGDERQLKLLNNNVDLIAPLQSPQRVQELAFRRRLCGKWDGSENIYSAALLASIEEFRGEARGFLRSAGNWLSLYFEERDRNTDKIHRDKQLEVDDILEMAFAHFHIYGVKKLVDFILSWKPSEVIFRISRLFTRRLIDAGDFVTVDEIANLGCNSQYLMIAITEELISVGKFPPLAPMQQCLDLLIDKQIISSKPVDDRTEQEFTSAIVSFAEASSAIGLSNDKIIQVLNDYLFQKSFHFVSSDYKRQERHTFLRGIALKSTILGEIEPNAELLIPREILEDKNSSQSEKDRKTEEFKQVIGGLLPWYLIRSRALLGSEEEIEIAFQSANEYSNKARSQRYRGKNDHLCFEIAQVRFESLIFKKSGNPFGVNITDKIFDNEYRLSLKDRLSSVRAAYRLEHLSNIKNQLEQSCYEMVESISDEGPDEKAEYYIALARAVLPHSPADAAAYFNCAIEAVSKFGDELVERWKAVVAMAKRSAEGGYSSPEIAYRFIRCAELVGESVTREKYWDRSEAIEVCSRLHPSSAFTALSRWRDRDIGWFDREIPALAHEAVRSKIISPSVGWSLSAFSWDYGFDKFITLCLETEPDRICRQYILDTAVRDLSLRDVSEDSWQNIKDVSDRLSLTNEDLQKNIAFYAKQPKTDHNPEQYIQISRSNNYEKPPNIEWGKILDNLDLTSSIGLSTAIGRFNTSPYPRHPETFWKEVFDRVPEGKISESLLAISTAENADFYNVKAALSNFPDYHRQKISVKKSWNNVILSIGERFASELTNYYNREYFFERICVEAQIWPVMKEGIIKGLSESSDLVSAGSLFGFSEIISSFISPEEASNLLEFALSRFEIHIDPNYGDGFWDGWLVPPDDIPDTFAGFVWAVLGSPRSAMRWQAAHCVRRLGAAGCEAEIDALIEWMNKDTTNAFGSHVFPFYNLHARLYLLIALARVAIDNPEQLRRHQSVFVHHALNVLPHALIQKFAAEIALSIEKAFPGTYDRETIDRLQQVGISQMPFKEIDGYGENIEKTPWHIRDEVNLDLNLHFGWDFDRYWFEPLGDVFGIFANQVEELTREIVLKEWNVETENESILDPRERLWNLNSSERETRHSHGSYPRTDNYAFYISYHAMFSVAAKLLLQMPIVHRHDWCDDEWADWLQGHVLTRSDGRWLADGRDPAPLERSVWLQEKRIESCSLEIESEDFLDNLLIQRSGKNWLNVRGSWSDSNDKYEENLNITSALALPESSQSLLNALSTCNDSRRFKLPDYQEGTMELDEFPFELQGWIYKESQDSSLDASDPHAGDINYPPYKIGNSIIEKLDISSDLDRRKWFMPDIEKESLICELWSLSKESASDKKSRDGVRINASLEFLKILCSKLNRDLIIEVQINRQLHRQSDYTRNNDDREYSPPISKIYLLSADGKLRDTRTCYQLR